MKAKAGITLTVTQDPLNTGDVATLHATINTHGGSADTDAITLKGLAFPSNKPHSIAQIILSGTNPSNPDHFLAIRGQATFDKTGHLTRMTGMVWDHITDTYTIDKHGTQSGPVECFDSVTSVTAKKPPSSGGGSGRTLSVTGLGAPTSVGGTFSPDGKFTRNNLNGNIAGILWVESSKQAAHAEVVVVSFDITTNEVVEIIFSMADLTVGKARLCTGTAIPGLATCDGVTVNRAAGTVILANQVLQDDVSSNPTITLNGTLIFTPF